MVALDGQNIKLFWIIDADGDRKFIVTFPSFVTDQAQNILAQFNSLVYDLKGVEVLTLMSDTDQHQALSAPQDTERMYARSKMDVRLEEMMIAA